MEHEFDYLDRIHIRDLLLRCIIGISPAEREKKQDVLINVTIFADLSAAGKSDDIKKTVNYKSIKNDIITVVESSSFFLVERIAQAIADACLKYDLVSAVRVLVEKPGALRFARSVGVEITRTRK